MPNEFQQYNWIDTPSGSDSFPYTITSTGNIVDGSISYVSASPQLTAREISIQESARLSPNNLRSAIDALRGNTYGGLIIDETIGEKNDTKRSRVDGVNIIEMELTYKIE